MLEWLAFLALVVLYAWGLFALTAGRGFASPRGMYHALRHGVLPCYRTDCPLAGREHSHKAPGEGARGFVRSCRACGKPGSVAEIVAHQADSKACAGGSVPALRGRE